MSKRQDEELIEIEFCGDELSEDIEVDNVRRNIYIGNDIDDGILDYVPMIIDWNREDKENELPIEDRIPIKIHINSNGGAVDPAMILISVIQLSETPVYTVVNKAYSSGFLISQAGHKRFAFPYSKALIHSGSISMEERLHELPNQVKSIEKQEKQIESYIISKTKITQQQYKKNYNKEWILFTDDMLENGVIDEVVTSIDVLF